VLLKGTTTWPICSKSLSYSGTIKGMLDLKGFEFPVPLANYIYIGIILDSHPVI